MKNGTKAVNSAGKNKLTEIRSRKALQELFYRWMLSKGNAEKVGAN